MAMIITTLNYFKFSIWNVSCCFSLVVWTLSGVWPPSSLTLVFYKLARSVSLNIYSLSSFICSLFHIKYKFCKHLIMNLFFEIIFIVIKNTRFLIRSSIQSQKALWMIHCVFLILLNMLFSSIFILYNCLHLHSHL